MVTDLSQNVKLKNVRNIYFAFREVETTLEYSILVNIPEKDKAAVYEKEKQGYTIVKVLAIEDGVI